MTRRTTRVLWGLIGICLFAGAVVSVALLVGSPEWARSMDLRRLEVLLDGMALLFWMLVFAFYWANKND
jgi:hypothetical protein